MTSTRSARTAIARSRWRPQVHSGPVFWDIPIDVIFAPAPREERPVTLRPPARPSLIPDAIARARALLDEARHPV